LIGGSQAYKDFAPLGLRAVAGAVVGSWLRESGRERIFLAALGVVLEGLGPRIVTFSVEDRLHIAEHAAPMARPLV